MLGSCSTFPRLKYCAVDLSFQDPSVGQLIYLPMTQVMDSYFCLTRLKCLAVGLLSQDPSVGQLIYLPRTQVLGS